MLLAAQALHKAYGMHIILENISFIVNATDRIGLVGANGVGKTTLLRLLVRQEEADSGTISYAPSVEYGYLAQTTPPFYGHTINDLLLASVGILNDWKNACASLKRQWRKPDQRRSRCLWKSMVR